MQFVKPNVLHRPGPAVSEDHGFADKLGLGFFESAEDRGRTDLRRVKRQQVVRSSKWSVSLIRNKRRSDCNVPPFVGIAPCQLSVFLLDYRQSDIRGAAFNEQISLSA